MWTRIPDGIQFLVTVEDREVLSVDRIECSTVGGKLGRIVDGYRHEMVLSGHVGGEGSLGVPTLLVVVLSAEKGWFIAGFRR